MEKTPLSTRKIIHTTINPTLNDTTTGEESVLQFHTTEQMEVNNTNGEFGKRGPMEQTRQPKAAGANNMNRNQKVANVKKRMVVDDMPTILKNGSTKLEWSTVIT